jgi:hypothetical protein
MKIISLITFTFLLAIPSFSQTTKKVCWLGNSYTYVNDLPTLVSQIATADGNTLIKDQNTPGGHTLQGHATNATSLAKISSNTWDYVVLQDQSQMPSFPWNQVVADVLPYAEILCDSIRSANPCAVPLFYNTWGRRDGDSQWDSINTFTKMNQRLYNGYTVMADNNSGKRAPIGNGFAHVGDDLGSPIAFNSLYQTDGSHPSIYGSYLAACMFYEMVFEETSQGNTYLPSGITASEATYLQNVANHILNDVDSVDLDYTIPFASFSYTSNGTEITFINESEHSFEWDWDFGNGGTSTDQDPVYDFGSNGTYTIVLTATNCGQQDDTTITINTALSSEQYSLEKFELYPNPSNSTVHLVYNGDLQKGELYTLDGKLVMEISLNEKSIPLQKSGVYVLRIGSTAKRIVFQ